MRPQNLKDKVAAFHRLHIPPRLKRKLPPPPPPGRMKRPGIIAKIMGHVASWFDGT